MELNDKEKIWELIVRQNLRIMKLEQEIQDTRKTCDYWYDQWRNTQKNVIDNGDSLDQDALLTTIKKNLSF